MPAGKKLQPLRSSQQFRAVYDRGARMHSHLFSLFILETTGQEARIGITVTRKIGSAVVRNRCKRRLREVARRSTVPLSAGSGCDIVINAKAAMIKADLNEMVTAFSQTLSRYRETANRKVRGGENTK